MKKYLSVLTLLVLFLPQVTLPQAPSISIASPADGLPGSMLQPTVLFGLIVILMGAMILGLSVAALNHSRKV